MVTEVKAVADLRFTFPCEPVWTGILRFSALSSTVHRRRYGKVKFKFIQSIATGAIWESESIRGVVQMSLAGHA